jgi:serine/threonine protein kinase
MAPEIWRGEPVTRETDIYAMGALLYELCAGAPPHIEVPLTELPRIASEQDAPPLLRVAPTVDPRFAEIVDRCLKRDARPSDSRRATIYARHSKRCVHARWKSLCPRRESLSRPARIRSGASLAVLRSYQRNWHDHRSPPHGGLCAGCCGLWRRQVVALPRWCVASRHRWSARQWPHVVGAADGAGPQPADDTVRATGTRSWPRPPTS